MTSALASSISSRTRTVTRSETSVSAAARFSLLSGKALEDQGGDEAAGECAADRDLGAVGGRTRRAAGGGLTGRWTAGLRGGRARRPAPARRRPASVAGRGLGRDGRPPTGGRGLGRRPARRPAGRRLDGGGLGRSRRVGRRDRLPGPGWRASDDSARPAAAAARSLGRVFPEHALIYQRRGARRGHARQRADPGQQAGPDEALEQGALAHRRGF